MAYSRSFPKMGGVETTTVRLTKSSSKATLSGLEIGKKYILHLFFAVSNNNAGHITITSATGGNYTTKSAEVSYYAGAAYMHEAVYEIVPTSSSMTFTFQYGSTGTLSCLYY